jgi:putative DNA primase/helicase
MWPSGTPPHAYVPPSINGELADSSRPLLVTEGQKKALKATQDGFATIGLLGVDCWHGKRSSALIPDLARIEWKGRRVYLVFDSDATENENVRENESLLGVALKNHGADVRVVRLPAGPGGEKVGFDDFLVAHGADALHRLLSEAEEPEPPEPDSEKRPASELDPASEAKAMLDADTRDGVSRLRFWRGTFWRWTKGGYRELQNSEIRARIVRALNCRYFKLGGTVLSNVVEQLRAQSILWADTEAPCWLEKPPRDWGPVDVLPMRSRLIHLPSLVSLDNHALDATPRFFTTAALDYDLGDDTTEPVQDWVGYCLTPDTRQHKILLIVGPRRSGKGTIARVLRAMIGPANVCGPTLASLATNFGCWPLIGKTIAIISDARVSGRTDQAVVVERLLTISGEDALTIDRKHLEPITCRLHTRLIILANELPRLGDSSGALSSRFVLLRLTESFLGREDHQLTDRLLGELPAILWWAITGWLRLQERGRFIEPESGGDLRDELENITSPIGAFIRQRCMIGPQYQAVIDDLFSEWKTWCEGGGRKPGNVQTFGRDLRAAVPSLHQSRLRSGEDRTRAYDGIGLLPLTGG